MISFNWLSKNQALKKNKKIEYHLKSKILCVSSDLKWLKLLDKDFPCAETDLFCLIPFYDESSRVLFIWLILGDKYNFPLISEKSLIDDWVLEFVF